MIIRALQKDDEVIPQLRDIHDKYFKDQFSFGDFVSGYFSRIIAINDSNQVVAFAGVRPIAEMVAISDLSLPVRERREAYINLLQASMQVARMQGFDGLHAFIQDERWEKVVRKFGFRDTKGKALCIEV